MNSPSTLREPTYEPHRLEVADLFARLASSREGLGRDDARLFEANGLKVDNSPLTGECEPQRRTVMTVPGARLDSRNLVLMGTMVTTGTGKGLVYATGDPTEIGSIAGVTVKTERVETPIHRELGYFVRIITTIALVVGAVFFVAGWAIGKPFRTNLIFAIGIIVANVPEGLLPTVTLALASGDPTETALLPHAEKAGRGAVERRRSESPRVYERPFDSATREMATVHRVARGLEALLKGAPEVVIEQCSHVRRDGSLVPMTSDVKARIREKADDLARSAKRVLALARRSVDAGADMDAQVIAGGYELVGLVAMHDPPRPEVAAAVARCLEAGIRTVVVSGDHPLTVQAIAVIGDSSGHAHSSERSAHESYPVRIR